MELLLPASTIIPGMELQNLAKKLRVVFILSAFLETVLMKREK
jgi:hypothetical protein